MKVFRPVTFVLSAVSASAFLTTTGSQSAAMSRRAFVTISSFAPQQQQARVLSTSTWPRSMSAAGDFAKTEIDKNKVVIFSKSYCPHCTKTKDLFKNLKVDGTVIYELDDMKNGADIQAALLDMTGQRTVPNVFIKGKHVGGNDNVQAANKSGKLKELLGV